jgi:WD40 repeat protein
MSDVRLPDSPYKGLVPFEQDDASFFFGREQERKIIIANLRTRRLTLLYGPSGVGKSSLINAGVVYHLRQRCQLKKSDKAARAVMLAETAEDSANDRLAVSIARSEIVGSRKPPMVIVFKTWIGNPLARLQDLIIASLREFLDNGYDADDEEKLRSLKLTEMLEAVLKLVRGELLIIFDQFEEYFVYQSVDEEFDDELTRAVANADLGVNFMISIREDWLARLDRYKGRIPKLFETAIRIDHLERPAAHEAIAKPIEKYNEILHDSAGNLQARVEITKGFISEALDQLERLDESEQISVAGLTQQSSAQAADLRIQPPRLQVVLQHLWNRVKHDTSPKLDIELFPRKDTAKRIIQSHLHETLDHLTGKEKRMAASFLSYLVTDTGTKVASTVGGLAKRCGRSPENIHSLLERLSERNVGILDRVPPPPGQPNQTHYQLASDVLASPLIAWASDIRVRRRRKQVWGWWMISIVVTLIILVITGAFLRAREQGLAIQEQARLVGIESAKAERALNAVRRQDERIPYAKAVLRAHGERVTSAVFTADGQRVLTASADGSAILWDVNSNKAIQEFNKDKKGLVCAAINPKGDLVVTASIDGTVMLWVVNSEGNTQLRGGIGKHVTTISFSPNGQYVAAANTAGEVILWKTSTRDRVREIAGNGNAIRQLTFSPSGELIAAASDDHAVHVWQGPDWSTARVMTGHNDKVNGIAFSPNESFVASASADTTVRIWDLADGSSRVFRGHAKSVNSVAYDKDGQHLLTSSDDQTARVWKIDTMKSVPLVGHTDKVLSASFSPNGPEVVTASRDNTARIWSAITGRSLVELRGHVNQVTYVTYSRDGKYVLTASEDATAIVWNAPTSANFVIDQPTINAIPNFHPGPCPVTVSFPATITALNGSGTVVYRFKGSDGRIWPPGELTFDEPGSKQVTWYWRITEDHVGSETIEVIEPKGIKAKKARFTVKCTKNESPSPSPTPTATP